VAVAEHLLYTGTEQPLAADLLGCFGPGMLFLADRKFLFWAMACAFLTTGAHILWRASASFTLKPVKALADGTYLAEQAIGPCAPRPENELLNCGIASVEHRSVDYDSRTRPRPG
jgi:hypothetical protein